jgi:hypothetical protein
VEVVVHECFPNILNAADAAGKWATRFALNALRGKQHD